MNVFAVISGGSWGLPETSSLRLRNKIVSTHEGVLYSKIEANDQRYTAI